MPPPYGGGGTVTQVTVHRKFCVWIHCAFFRQEAALHFYGKTPSLVVQRNKQRRHKVQAFNVIFFLVLTTDRWKDQQESSGGEFPNSLKKTFKSLRALSHMTKQ